MRRVLFATMLLLTASAVRADDWPQWLGPKRDGVWRETGILSEFPKAGPKVRWRVPVEYGYAGPAVAEGRVFVTDFVPAPKAKMPLQNGFNPAPVEGKERVLCLNEEDGKQLWKHEYDRTYKIQFPAGPRCIPCVDGDRVYTLGAMGDLFCLDVKTGKPVWSKDLIKEYDGNPSVWGFAASPLIDGDKIICLVGGKDALVVAFDKKTGKELWKALSASEPGYCPPVIYTFAGKRQLIIWHPRAVVALDPETGKTYWTQPFFAKAGLSVSMPRQMGDNLFITSFYNSAMMLKVGPKPDEVSVVWKGNSDSEMPKGTRALHSIMPTPFIQDGHIYGVCSYGELRCLKADTGERIWQSLEATGGASERWANAFLVFQKEDKDERFFLFNEKGDLIIAHLTPKGYEEVSRWHLLEPSNHMPRRAVVWTHPAFANKSVYARNDKEIVCASLAK